MVGVVAIELADTAFLLKASGELFSQYFSGFLGYTCLNHEIHLPFNQFFGHVALNYEDSIVKGELLGLVFVHLSHLRIIILITIVA